MFIDDSGMEQGKSDDSEDREARGSYGILETVHGEVYGNGEPCEYSYRMVYTQESIRVLDLRFIPADVPTYRLVRRILGAKCRGAGYCAGEIKGL